MGINISVITKLDNTENDPLKQELLSRPFTNLILGINAYGDDCEFLQLEKILEIDLKILLQGFVFIPPPIQFFESKLEKVEVWQPWV